MGDEVKKYTSALDMALDKWQKQAQKDLAKDLTPISKELEQLQDNKNPGPDEKKQYVDLLKESRRIIEKRMKTNLTAFNTTVKKVKQPGELDDKQSNVLDGQLKDISEDYTKLELPDLLTDKLPGLKDIDIKVNVDDKGFIVAKKWTFGG